MQVGQVLSLLQKPFINAEVSPIPLLQKPLILMHSIGMSLEEVPDDV